MLITILAFLGVLIGIILVHEIGHFVTAKLTKVRVLDFGIGFPPRIFAIRRGETDYSINAIPIGGFVKMAGEENPNISGSLASKSPGARLLVLSAGSLMNLILPLFLFTLAFMIPQNIVSGQIVVQEVIANSPAEMVGMQSGDTILSINGEPLHNIGDLHRYVHLNLGKETAITVRHSDSTTDSLQLTPRWRPPEGEGATGISIRLLDSTIIRQPAGPFWKAIPHGFKECVETFVLFKNEILSWFIGATAPVIVGPVGIARITGEVARSGISNLLELAAFISINLGIINLIPIPAMDGGRIAFVLLEVIRRGRRISHRAEGIIHMVGFVLLISLMLTITYRDIINIVSGNSVIP